MRHRLAIATGMVVAVLVLALQAYAQTTTEQSAAFLPLVLLDPSPTPAPTPTLVPTPRPAPTPPPAFFGDCNSTPRFSDAPNFPLRIAILNKFTEEVVLQNLSDELIDLTEWKLCSLTSNKQHTIPPGTIIRPQGSVIIPRSSAPVWDDQRRDDGALYDPGGRLIAYYIDAGQ
ncbi:MAG: lamin tail domain-containing protein [Oscillochloridaceae bacterium umkhey_bin13]